MYVKHIEAFEILQVIVNYNKFMGGIADLAIHYGSTQRFSRKSIKWWRKFLFWGLETSAMNSYILYKILCNQNGIKPVGDFRQGAKKCKRPSTSRCKLFKKITTIKHFITVINEINVIR